MAVRDTLNQIENLVASASHLPLTGKTVIDENDLIHLVEELRNDLPLELERADEIMRERDNLMREAQAEADRIIKQAKEYAEKLVDQHEISEKAREKSRTVIQQAQQQEQEVMERTRQNSQQLRDDADRYANQVFEQLITHVTNTFQGVQQAEQGLQQARQVLQQARDQMNRASRQAQEPVSYDQGNIQATAQQQMTQPGYSQAAAPRQ